ncbi:fusaric acid resistance family protein [Sphaerotilus hippei]|uniref:Fusaric acid resistance family protein n=1 Tax=Sphaerotilus hippei TaxID=744406 RepID=A0A318H501_9BURK|nr:FUSC family protein [Sphaerotilus hippei]PXW94212.1 fusaric acid resistance family protein [Sphaerotilus hippei]
MNTEHGWKRLARLLRAEWQHLVAVQASNRRWQLPLAAALATGLPLLIGACIGHLEQGLVASMGALVLLHTPDTPMHHRMASLMACSFMMTASYALGVASHFLPGLTVVVLATAATLITMLGRIYALGPPGSLFFVMAAAIGAYTPAQAAEVPLLVGLMFLGTLQACLIAFGYSLWMLRLRAAEPARPLPRPTFDFVVLDPVVIGVFVGLSLALAQALQLERPYWVPVSCLAVIQGASLRAVWNRQLHRVLGTCAGLLLSWLLLLWPMDPWRFVPTMMVLTFIVEMVVVRHYGFAVIFITPLTLLLAEAATTGRASAVDLMQARLLDTVLGCLMGLLGGLCLHHAGFRQVAGRLLRRLVPVRP